MNELQWKLAQAFLGFDQGPLDEIIPAGQLSASAAIKVYTNGYKARLIESLHETFEAVSWALGHKKFIEIATNYIEQNPSRVFNLSHYGEAFPKFLAQCKVSQTLLFLPELAQFEWEFCQLFHAPIEKAPQLSPEVLTNQQMTIGLVCHLRLMQFNYSIGDLWNAFFNEQKKLPPWHKPQALILYRVGSDLRLKELTLGSYYLLNYLRQRIPLQECIDHLLALGFNLTSEEVTELFSFLAAEGLVEATQNKL